MVKQPISSCSPFLRFLSVTLHTQKVHSVCYGSTKTGYRTTSVWCRGRSRNVEGSWGFSYLKIEKLPNSHFMFFDRYEIHIEAFGNFIYAMRIIFRSSSSENLIWKWDNQIPPKRTKTVHGTFKHFKKKRIFEFPNMIL